MFLIFFLSWKWKFTDLTWRFSSSFFVIKTYMKIKISEVKVLSQIWQPTLWIFNRCSSTVSSLASTELHFLQWLGSILGPWVSMQSFKSFFVDFTSISWFSNLSISSFLLFNVSIRVFTSDLKIWTFSFSSATTFCSSQNFSFKYWFLHIFSSSLVLCL